MFATIISLSLSLSALINLFKNVLKEMHLNAVKNCFFQILKKDSKSKSDFC